MLNVRVLTLKALRSRFVSYFTRAFLGFAIGYVLLISFPQYDVFWLLLSILLVISPEKEDAWKLTYERVISNLIGSLSGLTVVFINWPSEIIIPVAMMLAIVVCRALNIMKVVRSAVVAVLIILIEHKEEMFSPFERFFLVLIGCLIGLLVTFVVAFILKKSYIIIRNYK